MPFNKLYAGGRHDIPRPSPSVGAEAHGADEHIAISHAEYVPTLTAAAALRVKAAMSKAAVKVVSESRVTWAGLSPYQFWSSYRPLCSRLRPDVRDKQTSATDRRQINASPISGGGIIRTVL